MPNCQDHTEQNEDVDLYSRRDELQDPNSNKETSMERPTESTSQIRIRNFSKEKCTSQIGQSKLSLPKPVAASSAPLFDAYSESARLNDDDDIQGMQIWLKFFLF